ncbi:S1 family peptidase [Sutcliffiella cohnii]
MQELDNIKSEILASMESFDPTEYQSATFELSVDTENERLILFYNGFSRTMINYLESKFSDILQTEEINEIPEPDATRESNFNNLGAGIGIKNKDGGSCTTGGMATRNGQYFILTAAHCFKGTVSSTNGAVIRQYNSNVGIQHSDGLSHGLDVGLVRVTNVNTLYGGRYATNKIWITGYNGTYDGTIYSTHGVMDGMTVYKTGKRTGFTSGKIKYANTTVKYSGYPTFKVAQVEGAFNNSGDSGGAVYIVTNNRIYLVGLVSGSTKVNGTPIRGYFTKITDVRNAMNITVYTSSTRTKIVD